MMEAPKLIFELLMELIFSLNFCWMLCWSGLSHAVTEQELYMFISFFSFPVGVGVCVL